MHEFGREDRVGAQMRRELSALIPHEVKDPRLGMVTIQEVRVSRDLSHAKVFFTVMDQSRLKETTAILDKAAPFLRRRLGECMKLRSLPQLHFEYDTSIEAGARLSSLIERAVADDERRHQED